MIAAVVAYSQNFAIGKKGKIPWHIPEDLHRFSALTKFLDPHLSSNNQNTVIMGRKTWESLPAKFRPLPQRNNIVITSQTIEGVSTFTSLPKAIMFARLKFGGNIFLIGGQRVYEEGLPYADMIYATEVDVLVEDADAFFPQVLPSKEWTWDYRGGVRHYATFANECAGYNYRFLDFRRVAGRISPQSN